MPHSNTVESKKYQQEYYQRTKARKVLLANRSRMLRIYGIDDKEKERLFNLQGRSCPICGRTSDSRWCVDHDHDTGEIRGVLCGQCNRGMGLLGDDPKRLVAAATYLHWYKTGMIVPGSSSGTS